MFSRVGPSSQSFAFQPIASSATPIQATIAIESEKKIEKIFNSLEHPDEEKLTLMLQILGIIDKDCKFVKNLELPHLPTDVDASVTQFIESKILAEFNFQEDGPGKNYKYKLQPSIQHFINFFLEALNFFLCGPHNGQSPVRQVLIAGSSVPKILGKDFFLSVLKQYINDEKVLYIAERLLDRMSKKSSDIDIFIDAIGALENPKIPHSIQKWEINEISYEFFVYLHVSYPIFAINGDQNVIQGFESLVYFLKEKTFEEIDSLKSISVVNDAIPWLAGRQIIELKSLHKKIQELGPGLDQGDYGTKKLILSLAYDHLFNPYRYYEMKTLVKVHKENMPEQPFVFVVSHLHDEHLASESSDVLNFQRFVLRRVGDKPVDITITKKMSGENILIQANYLKIDISELFGLSSSLSIVGDANAVLHQVTKKMLFCNLSNPTKRNLSYYWWQIMRGHYLINNDAIDIFKNVFVENHKRYESPVKAFYYLLKNWLESKFSSDNSAIAFVFFFNPLSYLTDDFPKLFKTQDIAKLWQLFLPNCQAIRNGKINLIKEGVELLGHQGILALLHIISLEFLLGSNRRIMEKAKISVFLVKDTSEKFFQLHIDNFCFLLSFSKLKQSYEWLLLHQEKSYLDFYHTFFLEMKCHFSFLVDNQESLLANEYNKELNCEELEVLALKLIDSAYSQLNVMGYSLLAKCLFISPNISTFSLGLKFLQHFWNQELSKNTRQELIQHLIKYTYLLGNVGGNGQEKKLRDFLRNLDQREFNEKDFASILYNTNNPELKKKAIDILLSYDFSEEFLVKSFEDNFSLSLQILLCEHPDKFKNIDLKKLTSHIAKILFNDGINLSFYYEFTDYIAKFFKNILLEEIIVSVFQSLLENKINYMISFLPILITKFGKEPVLNWALKAIENYQSEEMRFNFLKQAKGLAIYSDLENLFIHKKKGSFFENVNEDNLLNTLQGLLTYNEEKKVLRDLTLKWLPLLSTKDQRTNQVRKILEIMLANHVFDSSLELFTGMGISCLKHFTSNTKEFLNISILILDIIQGDLNINEWITIFLLWYETKKPEISSNFKIVFEKHVFKLLKAIDTFSGDQKIFDFFSFILKEKITIKNSELSFLLHIINSQLAIQRDFSPVTINFLETLPQFFMERKNSQHLVNSFLDTFTYIFTSKQLDLAYNWLKQFSGDSHIITLLKNKELDWIEFTREGAKLDQAINILHIYYPILSFAERLSCIDEIFKFPIKEPTLLAELCISLLEEMPIESNSITVEQLEKFLSLISYLKEPLCNKLFENVCNCLAKVKTKDVSRFSIVALTLIRYFVQISNPKPSITLCENLATIENILRLVEKESTLLLAENACHYQAYIQNLNLFLIKQIKLTNDPKVFKLACEIFLKIIFRLGLNDHFENFIELLKETGKRNDWQDFKEVISEILVIYNIQYIKLFNPIHIIEALLILRDPHFGEMALHLAKVSFSFEQPCKDSFKKIIFQAVNYALHNALNKEYILQAKEILEKLRTAGLLSKEETEQLVSHWKSIILEHIFNKFMGNSSILQSIANEIEEIKKRYFTDRDLFISEEYCDANDFFSGPLTPLFEYNREIISPPIVITSALTALKYYLDRYYVFISNNETMDVVNKKWLTLVDQATKFKPFVFEIHEFGYLLDKDPYESEVDFLEQLFDLQLDSSVTELFLIYYVWYVLKRLLALYPHRNSSLLIQKFIFNKKFQSREIALTHRNLSKGFLNHPLIKTDQDLCDKIKIYHLIPIKVKTDNFENKLIDMLNFISQQQAYGFLDKFPAILNFNNNFFNKDHELVIKNLLVQNYKYIKQHENLFSPPLERLKICKFIKLYLFMVKPRDSLSIWEKFVSFYTEVVSNPLEAFKEIKASIKEIEEIYYPDLLLEAIDFTSSLHNYSFTTSENIERKLDKLLPLTQSWFNKQISKFKTLHSINLLQEIAECLDLLSDLLGILTTTKIAKWQEFGFYLWEQANNHLFESYQANKDGLPLLKGIKLNYASSAFNLVKTWALFRKDSPENFIKYLRYLEKWFPLFIQEISKNVVQNRALAIEITRFILKDIVIQEKSASSKKSRKNTISNGERKKVETMRERVFKAWFMEIHFLHDPEINNRINELVKVTKLSDTLIECIKSFKQAEMIVKIISN